MSFGENSPLFFPASFCHCFLGHETVHPQEDSPQAWLSYALRVGLSSQIPLCASSYCRVPESWAQSPGPEWYQQHTSGKRRVGKRYIRSQPTYAVHFVVNQLKGYSSVKLRKEFPKLKSRLPTLWTRSYFVESVGHISEDTMKKYIENQKNVWERYHPLPKDRGIHALILIDYSLFIYKRWE